MINRYHLSRIDVTDLVFDLNSPRLVEFGLRADTTEREVIRFLWDAMDVRELVFSIASGGYTGHDPLIVSEEDGKNVVIEGNRRLAAVKILLMPEVAEALNVEVPSVPEDRRNALQTLPAVFANRADSWRYLGFKHINGPAKWSSYAKARYIADVHRNYGITLDAISQHIGDTHGTVHRFYRGIIVLEQAERLKLFDLGDRWWSHFSFSHLYMALSYPGISGFLGLQSEAVEIENPVPADRKEQLRELLRWIYGSKRGSLRPIADGGAPHLQQLDAVVSSAEAVNALRSGSDLASAYELSRPSSTAFAEALLASKRSLQKARGLSPTGYHGSREMLRVAGSVADLADDLYEEMNREQRPQ